MGRKSTAQHLIEELEEDDMDEEVYLVAYDFLEKPSSRFWNNLNEIISVAGGYRVQYSVYFGNRKGARLVKALAERFGADVKWYAAFELT